MRKTLEQKLLASRPADAANHAFVTRTMDAVRIARGNETFNEVLRTTNATKKEHLFMKLRHLPRFAAISIIIAGLVAVSGTAYAAYQLWLKPTATVQSSSQNQALIKLRNCDEYGGNTDLHVVINKSNGLSPSEAAKYVQADCEIDAVQSWAINTLQGNRKEPSDILFPYTVQSIRDNTIRLHDGNDWRSIQVNSSTVYVTNGSYATKEAITPGDTVAYVVDEKNTHTIRAVVKFDLRSKYYGSNPNAYFVLDPCSGNPQAWCGYGSGSLDVIPSGEVGANPNATGNWYEIEGRLVSYTPTALFVRDTAGELHTITTNTDIIDTFNAGNGYGPITVDPGDVLDIMYRQSPSVNHTNVTANQLEEVQLMMAQIGKQYPTATNSQKYHY